MDSITTLSNSNTIIYEKQQKLFHIIKKSLPKINWADLNYTMCALFSDACIK